MRIISTFKDYYDNISLSDYSSQLVFNRETHLIVASENAILKELKDKFSFVLKQWGTQDTFGYLSPFIVFINKKAFLGLMESNDNRAHLSTYKKPMIYYQYEDAVSAIQESKSAKHFNSNKLLKIFEQFPMETDILTKHDIHLALFTETSIDHYIQLDTSLQAMFTHMKKTSNRYFNSIALWVNPKLDAIQFQKVMDPYTLTQEIEMMVANQSNPENNLIQVANNDRIVQHGFDLKQSFRKRKTT